MTNDVQKYLDHFIENGGTGKLFNFKLIEYRKGFLKLNAEFKSESLNPGGSVQGGQINSMLDDVTSLLLIFESNGLVYFNSTNLHSIHHRPLFQGSVTATAELIKKGKNIVTMKGEVFNQEDKLAATLIHTALIIKK
tara:strand:- start:4 stop:414 length:411 start_codon:yes stop_codon:yes gene_type:complete